MLSTLTILAAETTQHGESEIPFYQDPYVVGGGALLILLLLMAALLVFGAGREHS